MLKKAASFYAAWCIYYLNKKLLIHQAYGRLKSSIVFLVAFYIDLQQNKWLFTRLYEL